MSQETLEKGLPAGGANARTTDGCSDKIESPTKGSTNPSREELSAPGLKDVESHQEPVEIILREPLQKQQKRKERDRGRSEAQRFNALILC